MLSIQFFQLHTIAYEHRSVMVPCLIQHILQKNSRNSLLRCGVDELSQCAVGRLEVSHALDHRLISFGAPLRIPKLFLLGFFGSQLNDQIPAHSIARHRECTPLKAKRDMISMSGKLEEC